MPNEPGWFPDPWRPGRRRWWDGTGWTDHTHDPADPPAAAGAAPPPRAPRAPGRQAAPPPAMRSEQPDPRRDLALERGAARRAHPALALQAAAQIVNLVTTAFVADDIRGAFTGETSGTTTGWQRSQNLATVPAIVALVLLVLWAHRVATIAANLHYPARRSPAWAALGWLIPIANAWIPYRSLRDSLPPGNPAQRLVGRWWACYIASAYWVLVVLVVGLWSSGAALAVALPGVVAALVGARLGWEVVDEILADHADAIGRVAPPS